MNSKAFYPRSDRSDTGGQNVVAVVKIVPINGLKIPKIVWDTYK